MSTRDGGDAVERVDLFSTRIVEVKALQLSDKLRAAFGPILTLWWWYCQELELRSEKYRRRARTGGLMP